MWDAGIGEYTSSVCTPAVQSTERSEPAGGLPPVVGRHHAVVQVLVVLGGGAADGVGVDCCCALVERSGCTEANVDLHSEMGECRRIGESTCSSPVGLTCCAGEPA
jgi:hypothetical protein